MTDPRLNSSQIEQLDQTGFVVLNDAPLRFFDELARTIDELLAREGDRAGAEFKQEPGCRRLANLGNKGAIFREVVLWPPLLAGVRQVLGDDFKISSLNARSVNAHCDLVQPLHTDMGAVADSRGYWVCNSVWMLDDFTAENGAIRLIPGSHRWPRRPQDVLADPTAPHPDEILITGRRGTVVVMNAHLWHGGTANRTPRTRTAFHAFFVRRDKPQQQYQKRLLDAEVQAGLSPELRWLFALDDPRNDELCTTATGQSGFLK
jgi:ectoine hydroxylase-related dioxygenase (phytanoyl-CoA dioxygenase family)